MTYARYIREIGRGAEGSRDLSRDEAQELFAAMLDAGIPDLELGAILLALRVKGESQSELLGFLAALRTRTHCLNTPHGRPRPVVLASYNGARKEANLTPLIALLLQRMGIPVVVHCLLEGYGRVTSAQVFRELGVLPCVSHTQAQIALENESLALVPVSLLSPGIARLLSLRARMGVRNVAHSVVKLLNPFPGSGVLSTAATHPAFIDAMREVLLAEGERALLMRGTEGEPYANPKRRPRIDFTHDGVFETLFEAEHDSLKTIPHLPSGADAVNTALWIRRLLDTHQPLPLPLANQLSCCLYASGYVEEFNQAKAIVALEGNSFVHSGV